MNTPDAIDWMSWAIEAVAAMAPMFFLALMGWLWEDE